MAQNGGGKKKREKPNILVTGTPGTGKTTMSAALAEAANLRHINVGDLVKEKSLHDGWDEEFDCYVINEDLVCDELEDVMEQGGIIVDHHGCDFFPERWFDHVVVLQTENSVLYDRLAKRGYTGKKLSNNVECEIFQVMLEEAKDSYLEDIVVALKSDCVEDVDRNVSILTDWTKLKAVCALVDELTGKRYNWARYIISLWLAASSNVKKKGEFKYEVTGSLPYGSILSSILVQLADSKKFDF